MHEEMEQLTTQFSDEGISFPHEAMGDIEKSANVQALHAKVEGQLDRPQTESSTHIRHVGRQKRRRRGGAVEGHRQKGRILWIT